MNNRIWTISNGLSMFRVFLVVPMVLCLVSENPSSKYYAVGIIILAILTDVVDGFLARKLNQVTEFGKTIDPIADKIAVIVIAFVLAQQERIPFWYFMSAVTRDILILLGGIYVKRTKGIVLQSIFVGKLTVVIVSMYILLVVLNAPETLWLQNALMMLSAGLLVLSFLFYFVRFMQVLNPKPPISDTKF